MQGLGYDSDLARDVQQIRQVLDGYGERSWLKEMVQNADDAGATRLEFVWTATPVADATNPLVAQGPALVVFNDAPFTADNARAIRKLGSSDRNGDDGSIGRFGLGMKSLYHWCEAFIYLSSGHESFEIDARNKPDLVLSPWFHQEEGRHHDWRTHERAALLPRLHELGLIQDAPAWFCLWIPLRIAARDGDDVSETPPIVAKFLGDKGPEIVFGPDPLAELATALPMLKNLRTIRIQEADAVGSIRRRGVEFIRGERSERPLDFSWHSKKTFERTWSGSVGVGDGNGEETAVGFAGAERLLADDGLAEIHRDRRWPQTSGTDPKTFASKREKARRAPHAAAYLVRDPRPEPWHHLHIQMAAFLPLGDEPDESIVIDGAADFSLVLHGDFFPDASRTRVKLPARGEEPDVAQRWNRRLLDVGSLPLVLDALQRLAADAADEDVLHVTAGIAGSRLYAENRRAVCHDRQWAFLLEQETPRWAAVPADEPTHPMPAGPIARELFPRLAEVLGPGRHASPPERPRLHPTADALSSWPDELAARMVGSTSPRFVFENPANLSCLVEFLDLVGAGLGPETEKALRALVYGAYRELGASNLARLGGSLGDFLARIPDDRKLALDVAGMAPADVDRLMAAIAGLEPLPGAVVVPVVGESAGGASARLTAEDGERLLLLIGGDARPPSDEATSRLARQVAAATGPRPPRFGEACAELPLFLGRVQSEPDARLLSWKELADTRDRGLLFRDSAEGLQADLQAALRDRVVVDLADASPALFDGPASECSAAACLQVLERLPRLVEPREGRIRLLGLLVGSLSRPGDVERRRHGLRYLFHGRKDRFNDVEPRLFAGVAPGRSPVWWRLAERALARTDGTWALVDKAPLDVSEQDARRLGIVRLDPAAVAACLRRAGTGGIGVDDFSDEDRLAIVKECGEDDFDVARALPIHRTLDGRLVAIDGNAFWKGEYEVADDLPPGVTLLRPADDRELRARQLKMHPHEFQARDLLLRILKGPDPDRRWRTITSILGGLPDAKLDDELKSRLRETAWVPVANGEPATPEEVVRGGVSLDQELLRKVVADARPSSDAPRCVPLSALGPELDPADFYESVSCRIWRARDTAGRDLGRLGRFLAADERYRLGAALDTDGEIESFLDVFRDAPDDVMRSRRLMVALCERDRAAGYPQFKNCLLGRSLELRPERHVAVLRFLADDVGRDRELRGKAREWFGRYLKAAAASPAFVRDVLPRIRLLDRRGDWRDPGELSLDAEGVDGRHLLNDEHVAILKPKLESGRREDSGSEGPAPNKSPRPSPTPEDFDTLAEASADRLVEQARIWVSARDLPPETVGAFLALLGDHPRIAEAARVYLGSRRIEGILDRIGWKERKTIGGEVKASRHPREDLQGRRFLFEFNTSERVSVTNLLGERVERPLSKDFVHLWLGRGWHGGKKHRVELRAMAPDQTPPGPQMAGLLRETARKLLSKIYYQDDPAGLDDLWDELTRGEQLDVAVARSAVLRAALPGLRGLGAARTGPARDVLSKWDEAQEHRAEADRAKAKGRAAEASSGRADELEQKALDDLRGLLEGKRGDEPIQELLEAVRKKIHQFEYDEDSVPFELFQNADDAAVEWVRMHGDDAREDLARRFFLLSDADRLRVAHDGRPINRHRRGDFDGRPDGFHKDLVKMTQLNWSDKAGDDRVTGRFGLGFKSAFLVSDAPRALSGRLAFQIVAGFYPRELDEDGRRELAAVLDGDLRRGAEEGVGPDATLIELPLRDDVDPAGVVARFVLSAHVLVVFARRLRRCVVSATGVARGKSEWSEEAVPGAPDVHVGRLRPISDDAGRETDALVVRAGGDDPGALLIALDGRGFAPLPRELPSIWATAPLRDQNGYGLALNADFDLNAGRALLAQDEGRNRDAAERLGSRLGERLLSLFDAAERDWPTTRKALRLAPDADPRGLWESAWKVARAPLAAERAKDDPAGRLLRKTLWESDDRGFRRLARERDALPTGLPGKHAVSTRTGRVRHAVVGALAKPGVFEAASKWPGFQKKHEPGGLVDTRIAHDLKGLMKCDWPSIGLADALGEEFATVSSHVDPDLARLLGAVVTVEFVQSFDKDSDERKALEEVLRGATFRAADGRWRRAGELLVPDDGADHEEESARASFAPPESVLAADYDPLGREFARACRPAQRMNAPVESLVRWALEADEPRRPRALEYLAGGHELSGQVQEGIRRQVEDGRGGWIRDLRIDSPWLRDVDPNQRGRLLHNLGLGGWSEPAPVLPPQPAFSTQKALEAIHDWAMKNREDIARAFEHATYPGGRRPEWSQDGSGDSVEARKAWLVLLIFGSLHTMGRKRGPQDAGFLRLCENEGYLDVFADPSRNPERWMEVLRGYLDKEMQGFEYYHWMSQFVRIYQLSHWLDDYRELFLALDGIAESVPWFSLHSELRPRTVQGSVNAPPLDQTLGYGACHVVRELARAGVLRPVPALVRNCYSPYPRVIRLLQNLGFHELETGLTGVERLEQSGSIHDWLKERLGDRADFGGLYDLPLWRLATHEPTRIDVLGDGRFMYEDHGAADEEGSEW